MSEITVFKLSETCRVCLKNENDMTLLGENKNILNDALSLLSFIANSEITFNKILPNFICEKCNIKLSVVEDLKLKFDRSNIVLKECFKVYKQNTLLLPHDKLSAEEISRIKETTKINWNLDETCRVCLLKTDSMFSLENPSSELQNVNVFESLSFLSNSEITFNKLFPNFICTECNSKLEVFEDFKVTFERSNKLLGQCLKIVKPAQKQIEESEEEEEERVQIEHNYSASEIETVESTEDTTLENMKEEKTETEDKNRPVTLEQVEASMQKVRSIYEDKHRACFKCDFVGEHTHALRCHIGHFHKDLRNSWCSECNQTFPDLPAHVIVHLTCDFCPKTFYKKQHLLQHLPTHVELKERVDLFKCTKCSNSYACLNLLKEHSKVHKEVLLLCEHCPRTFCTEHGLRIHVRSVHKLHTCTKCAETFASEENLNQHVCAAKEKQKNFCTKCDTRVLSISQHNERFHGIPVNKDEEAKTLKSVCNVCGKRFPNDCKLKAHLRVHTGEKPFECEICNRRFAKRSLLRHHRLSHSGLKMHNCQYCDKGFTTTNALKIHEHKHLEKKYTCNICNKQFVNSVLLLVHLNKHKLAASTRFECEICGEWFLMKVNLQNHMSSHSNERPFTCRFCNNDFKDANSLKKHEKTHSEVKQYKCNLCPYVGKIALALKMHMSRHKIQLVLDD